MSTSEPTSTHPIIGELVHGDTVLPLYDALGITTDPREVGAAASPYGELARFTRYLRISHSVRAPLGPLLRASDELFMAAADRVGSTVVDHVWGLARIPNVRSAPSFMHPDLPRGYALVANVAVVPNARQLEGRAATQVDKRLGRFTLKTEIGHLWWHDGHSTQFVRDSRRQKVLVDIEPFFALDSIW